MDELVIELCVHGNIWEAAVRGELLCECGPWNAEDNCCSYSVATTALESS